MTCSVPSCDAPGSTEYLELAQFVYVVVAADQGDKVVALLSTKRRARAAAERTAKVRTWRTTRICV